MSAIVGMYHLQDHQHSREQGRRMMVELSRYPADRVHTWSHGPVFFGCHAVWVTPESVQDPLPYFDDKYNAAITADAILDNREELFAALDLPLSARKGMTDSELILLAYRKWDMDAPKHLTGDFAFMIWDPAKDRLFGARDETGTRTLYYHHAQERFAFSTVIAPLLALPDVKRELHEEWLAEFLTIPGMNETVNVYASPYRDIYQVPPAHIIRFERGTISFARFTEIGDVEPLRLKSSEEYVEAFRDVFHKAVKARLRTHKRVGVALSGGLDSGAVASFAVRTLREEGRTLHAYSYVPVPDFVDWTSQRLLPNEQPFIHEVASYTGNIQENYLDLAGMSPLTEMDNWLQLLEMPYKYFENTFWIKGLYQKARQDGAGILLTGAKGNFTVSWGPALEYYAQLLRRFKLLKLGSELMQYSRLTGLSKNRMIRVIGKRAFPILGGRNALNKQELLSALINPDFARRTGVFERIPESAFGLHGSKANAVEVRRDRFNNLSIANKNGTMATKMSLEFGVLERDPTNDPRVARFCLSVPYEQYVQNGQDRSLIRRATEGYLPDRVRLNQRVRGVQPADWVHRMMPSWPSFLEEIHAMCGDETAGAYMNMERMKAAASAVRNPHPSYATNEHVKHLMQGLIVYRFLASFYQQSARGSNPASMKGGEFDAKERMEPAVSGGSGG